MLDRNYIGHVFDSHDVVVEAGRVCLFVKVIGETNPIYLDQKSALEAGYKNIPVPPSYPFSLHLDASDFPVMLQLLDLDIAKVLHGSQEFEYIKTICVGDKVSCQSKIIDIYDKKNGELEFVVVEVTFTNQDDEVAVKARQTLVYRHKF